VKRNDKDNTKISIGLNVKIISNATTYPPVVGCIHRWMRGILGITWKNKVTNEEIRKRTGQTLLVNVIRERRLRWLGHVARMDEARIPKQALQWAVVWFKRRPGRPRTNWRDVVNKDLQKMGLTWEEVEASAQDRQTWRQRVALCIGDVGWIKSSQATTYRPRHTGLPVS